MRVTRFVFFKTKGWVSVGRIGWLGYMLLAHPLPFVDNSCKERLNKSTSYFLIQYLSMAYMCEGRKWIGEGTGAKAAETAYGSFPLFLISPRAHSHT